jgi:hypothetical protein
MGQLMAKVNNWRGKRQVDYVSLILILAKPA